MAKIYYEDDSDISLLNGKTIGIVGYGSQGHAHALNLHDNDQTVIVGLHTASKTRSKVIADGLEVTDVDDLAKRSDIIMMLIPDHLQAGIYRDSIEPYLDSGKMLMWAHGFAIHYRQIVPPPHVDVAMIAQDGIVFFPAVSGKLSQLHLGPDLGICSTTQGWIGTIMAARLLAN